MFRTPAGVFDSNVLEPVFTGALDTAADPIAFGWIGGGVHSDPYGDGEETPLVVGDDASELGPSARGGAPTARGSTRMARTCGDTCGERCIGDEIDTGSTADEPVG